MPKWIPEKIWEDQDVFIIGGGNSLELFDWELLKNENTIGCNDAFRHGSEICKICIFGDAKWFQSFKNELARYKGTVFTNCQQLQKTKLSWLWTMTRKGSGLHGDALGWNSNTGAAAVNLALLLGAKRIFLLGFDMHLSNNKRANWHQNRLDKPNENIYPKFLRGFKKLAVDWKKKFPDAEIINVTDNSSLDLFPEIGVDEFWEGRKKNEY